MALASRDFSFVAGFMVMLAGATAFVVWNRPSAPTAPVDVPAPLAHALDSLALSKRRGSASARDTLVELTDFFCPGCASANERLRARIDNAVRDGRLLHIVWEIPFQRGSAEVSVAADCVWSDDQERYWDYRDVLFDAQRAVMASYPVSEQLLRLAQREGVDSTRLSSCIRSRGGETTLRLRRAVDVALGEKVPFTPVFWLNGREAPVARVDSALMVGR